MEIEYDPAKDAVNMAKHGLSLADAVYMDLPAAAVERDDRFGYAEERFRAFGRIEGQGLLPRVHHSRDDTAPDQLPTRAREGDEAS